MPIDVSLSATAWNVPSTWSMRSRVTPFSFDIAWPIFCTSLGARYLNTCAASSSPSDIRRIALVMRPASLIAAHPSLDDVRDDLGAVAGNRAGALQRIGSAGRRHERLGRREGGHRH